MDDKVVMLTLMLTFMLVVLMTSSVRGQEDLSEQNKDDEFLEHDDNDLLEVDEIAQVECMTRNFADLFQSKDAQGFADRCSDDAVWLRCTNEVIKGRDEIRKGYDDWFKLADRQDDCTDVVADDLSDIHMIASARCNMYRDKDMKDDFPIEINRYIVILERIEGGGQITFQMNIEDRYEMFRDW